MAHAASTVLAMESADRSEVLALPRRWPKYTVTASALSRLYSTVSTSPSRTVTDWPTEAEVSASASLAPRARASSRARNAADSRAGRSRGSAWATGVSGMVAGAWDFGAGRARGPQNP